MEHTRTARAASTLDAKASLIEWGAAADEDLRAELHERAARASKFLPWLAGAAGFLAIVGAKKGVKGGRVLSRTIDLAIRAAPFVLGLARSSRAARSPAR